MVDRYAFVVLGAIELAIVAFDAGAYEVATHAALTREAYVRSRFGDPNSQLIVRLGLTQYIRDMGRVYLEDVGTNTKMRAADPPDPPEYIGLILDAANRGQQSFKPSLPDFPAWLMLGAVREDDLVWDQGMEENTPYDDDPSNSFTRVLNHFLDPYRYRPLSFTVDLGARADEWAIEGKAAASGPAKDRSNNFSLARARDAMWRALTVKQWPASGGVLVDLDLKSLETRLTSEAIRRAYWATVVRSTGNAVHLLQDMAQPQHTRNDAHAGLFCAAGSCIGGHASVYEKYVDARVRGRNFYRLRERFVGELGVNDTERSIRENPLDFGAYPVPRFNRFRDYFATAIYLDSINGKGLANFSNQGFYTVGTNIGSSEGSVYPSPPSTPGAVAFLNLPSGAEPLEDATGFAITKGTLRLYIGNVNDRQEAGESAALVRLSSYGMFDQFMELGQREPKFTLTHYNYRDQARLLIPRAVAYSAGLIDYFFRGRMEIRLPDEGVYALVDHQEAGCKDNCGFKDLKLKLKNKTNAGTDDKPIKEAMGAGTLAAVIQFHRNTCYTDPALAGDPGGSAFTGNNCRSAHEEIVVSDPVALQKLDYDEEKTFRFKFRKPIPINASDVVLQVVFRGKLGEELDAVAVETKDISEPNHLAVANSTDAVYDDAGDKKYHAVPYAGIPGPAILNTLKITFGTVGPAVACLDRLGGAEHAQIAFLTDRGSFTGRALVANWENISNPVVDLVWDESRSQFRRSAPFVFSRGWNRDTVLALTWSTLGGPKTTSMACLPGDGGICNDAALSPLQEAKMKRWSLTTDFGGAGCAS